MLKRMTTSQANTEKPVTMARMTGAGLLAGVDAVPRVTLRTVAGWRGAGASGVDRFVDRVTR
jgi:hypothetical protein